ncbi:hypothetical protein ACQ4PT_047273 [Festuca glaucescens]
MPPDLHFRAWNEDPPQYGRNSNLFTAEVNHNGFFCGLGANLSYVSSTVDYIDLCSSENWSMTVLDEILFMIGYQRDGKLHVYWCLPEKERCDGLLPLETNEDCASMLNLMKSEKCVVLFIDHTNFLKHLRYDAIIRNKSLTMPSMISPEAPMAEPAKSREEARELPFLSMLESIFYKILQRIVGKQKESKKWSARICPKIKKKLEKFTEWSNECGVKPAGNFLYLHIIPNTRDPTRDPTHQLESMVYRLGQEARENVPMSRVLGPLPENAFVASARDNIPAIGRNSNLFTAEVNHNGFFCGLGANLSYVSSTVDYIDLCSSENWSMTVLDEILFMIGYQRDGKLHVYWCLPEKERCDGLLPLETNEDCASMLNLMKSEKCVVLFIDHTNFLKHLRYDAIIRNKSLTMPSMTSPEAPMAEPAKSREGEASSSSVVV